MFVFPLYPNRRPFSFLIGIIVSLGQWLTLVGLNRLILFSAYNNHQTGEGQILKAPEYSAKWKGALFWAKLGLWWNKVRTVKSSFHLTGNHWERLCFAEWTSRDPEEYFTTEERYKERPLADMSSDTTINEYFRDNDLMLWSKYLDYPSAPRKRLNILFKLSFA